MHTPPSQSHTSPEHLEHYPDPKRSAHLLLTATPYMSKPEAKTPKGSPGAGSRQAALRLLVSGGPAWVPGWGHTEFLSKGQGTYCGSKPRLRGEGMGPSVCELGPQPARGPSRKAGRQEQGEHSPPAQLCPSQRCGARQAPDQPRQQEARPLNRSGIQSYTKHTRSRLHCHKPQLFTNTLWA